MQIGDKQKEIKLYLFLIINISLFSILMSIFLKQIYFFLCGLLIVLLFKVLLIYTITAHKKILVTIYFLLTITIINFILVLYVIENNNSLELILMRIGLISGAIGIILLIIEIYYMVEKIIMRKI